MIFYFSANGNTLWVAKNLAKLTDDRLLSMVSYLQNPYKLQLSENENIGFCFPVYGWQPPSIVNVFIEHLSLTTAHNHYCFAVCTAGDDIGETMKLFKNELKHLSLQPSALFSIIMPETYVGLPFMDVDTIANEQKKINEARNKLEFVGKYICSKAMITNIHKGVFPNIKTYLLGTIFTHWLVNDKLFHVDKHKCIKCGLCSKVCPVNDIVRDSEKYPQWIHNKRCLTCFACYHHCPKHAIDFGKRTKNKGQYYFNHSL